jgi:hypothetical protein
MARKASSKPDSGSSSSATIGLGSFVISSALPCQFYDSMEIPVWPGLVGKNERAGQCRAVSELELALPA